MEHHRPTLGSRIRALLRHRGVVECVCGRPWAGCEGGRWAAVEGPIPDGEPPVDIIRTLDGWQIRRGNGGRW